MTLTDPFWLVLAIPLVMSLWLWPLPSRSMAVLRWAASAMIILALCGLSVVLPVRSGTVVLVADRSLSMPPGSEALQKEAADIVHSAMHSGDKLAVVSFAETAAVEQSPQASPFAGFTVDVGREASRLADGLDLALSLVGKNDSGRILLLSDGQWTGRDVSASAARAAAAGVAIDYRALQRPGAGDLAIQRIEGPDSTLPGESFMITAWINSPLRQTVSYELQRGSQVIARGTQAVPSGASRLLFRDTAATQGVCDYQLRVQGQSPDPVPENNRARLLVGVRGARPLLCVSPAATPGLPALLSKGGIKVKSLSASQCNWTLEELAGYSAVLLENTPANLVGRVGMQNLATWVSHGGGGLMFTGGRDAYGPGGYYKSPLEPIMPVSLELRREHRKLSLAIVVALDRSGSMACTLPDGRAKIELADLATAEVLNMLGAMDQFGCIAVDVVPHEIVPFGDVTDKQTMRSNIMRIDSAGGGIYIYEALATAARMLVGAKAGTRHIILFADAADSRQHPQGWEKIVDACAKAGITVSVIGLGSQSDCDADLLNEIGKRGGGQCMFTNIAQELPRLFAQDTFVVARSAFLDEPVEVHPTAGLLGLTRQPLGDFPKIGGYNLCYIRPQANLAITSVDEYHAPVLSAWQAGLGRVLCYAGEANGKYTGAMAGWKSAGDFFASLARWTAGQSQGLGKGVVATQELRDGVCRIELHLDPGREAAPFRRLPSLTTLAARPGEAVTTNKIGMSWLSADTLVGEVPLSGSETLLTTLAAPGMGQTTLSPVCLPYSPEYLPPKPDRGAAAMEQLARATGGCQRLNLADVWNDIPRRPRMILLGPYLLLAAVLLFLLEVIQRRTGILSIRGASLGPLWRRATARVRVPRPSPVRGKMVSLPAGGAKKKAAVVAAPKKPALPASSPPLLDEPPAAKDFGNALSQAQQRARQRTKRR